MLIHLIQQPSETDTRRHLTHKENEAHGSQERDGGRRQSWRVQGARHTQGFSGHIYCPTYQQTPQRPGPL